MHNDHWPEVEEPTPPSAQVALTDRISRLERPLVAAVAAFRSCPHCLASAQRSYGVEGGDSEFSLAVVFALGSILMRRRIKIGDSKRNL
jgi:hypothetical protein